MKAGLILFLCTLFCCCHLRAQIITPETEILYDDIESFSKVAWYKMYEVSKNHKELVRKVLFFDNGLKKEDDHYEHNRVIFSERYQYVDTQLKTTVQKDWAANEVITISYTYDSLSHKLISEKQTNKEGNVVESSKIEYGNRTKTEYIKLDEDLHKDLRMIKTIFTPTGHLPEKIIDQSIMYDVGDTTYFIYDSKGALIREENYGNQAIEKWFYHYDSLGRNTLKQRIENDHGSLQCYTYYSPDEVSTESYAVWSPKDSLLTRKEIRQFKNGKKEYEEDINYYDTRDDDPDRLNKGSGKKLFFNSIGTSRVLIFVMGKIAHTYVIEYGNK